MAYKIKSKTKEIPASYFEEQEMVRLKKKNKGKFPSFLQIARFTTRRVSGIERRVHKKGAIVQFREGLGKIKKVSKKGLWIEPMKKPNGDLATPSGKIIFVPEKRVEKEVYPLSTNLPIYLVPPFQMKD